MKGEQYSTIYETPVLVTKENAIEAYQGNDTLESLATAGS
ncbi:hypothetical protein GCM10009706_21340 [Curtobacterium citreum]|nr:hypothetical protein FB462_0618 [Curtobacterium citreum]GGL82492.1 hypothetical protein GCM10009706_21340 [Curtobacterium citreum]